MLDCVKIVGTIDAPWEEVNKFYGAAHTYYDAFKKKNLKGEVLTELKNEANPGVEIVRVELLPGVPLVLPIFKTINLIFHFTKYFIFCSFVWNRVFYVCRKNEKITIDGKEKYFWYCPSIPQKFENILEKKVPEDQFKTFFFLLHLFSEKIFWNFLISMKKTLSFYTTKVQRKDDPKKFVVGDFFVPEFLFFSLFFFSKFQKKTN